MTQHTNHDVQRAWSQMPRAFRTTHPLPVGPMAPTWVAKARRDCRAVILVLLDTATADIAKGDHDAAERVHAEVRPFCRLKRALEAQCVAEQAGEGSGVLLDPCQECGANAGQECQPNCIAAGVCDSDRTCLD